MERFENEGRSVNAELRCRAEGRMIKQVADPSSQKEHDPRRLLHELQVHQIELEMQNEELSRLQKELESRILERTVEIERINSEQELFRYAISHEFRAPLVRLEGFATMMIEVLGADGEEQVIHCARRIMAATILEKHGGQIRVETSPGKGATFSITLASVQAKRSLAGVYNGNSN